jgi:S-adenosylmethionine:tRNA ribosyltransferase-isomerase
MTEGRQIKINEYDYYLPDEKIAKYPLTKRDDSKLLVMRGNDISSDTFKNICKYIPANSLLVFNDTKVIKARLIFMKETGSSIEIFCLEPINPVDYSMSLSSNITCSWKCLVGNNKKWKSGDLTKTIKIGNIQFDLTATKKLNIGNAFEIQFSWKNPNIIFSEILEAFGNIPIPPYLNRNSEDIDNSRYQTIYSKNKGSVAAPTAGLHFTEEVFESLRKNNVQHDSVTLHVGAGTFQPVKTELISDHEMHTEHFVITRKNIESLLKFNNNITVVGTTSVRTLESFYQVALQIYQDNNKSDNNFFVSQWQAYNQINAISKNELLENVLVWMQSNGFEQLNCATQIMIVPGYEFRFTNRLITNFHQPKSTLLLLLAAFIGDEWRNAYKYAFDNEFRFLSYGDSSIFIR